MHSRRKTIGALVLLMLLMIPAWAPLTRPGLPAWRPGALPVFNLYALGRGEGPITNLSPDGPAALLPAHLLHLAGLDGVAAIKTSLILALILLALVIFFWARTLWGEKAGALAAMLAIYTPALLSALFIQGTLALLWLLVGVGLIGWSLEMRGWRRWLTLLAGVALAGLNAPPLLHSPLLASSVSLSQLFEPPWFWDVGTIGLQTPVAWSLGLPLLGMTIIVAWLAFAGSSRADDAPPTRTLPALLILALFLLLDALVASGTLPLIFVLSASLLLAVAAAGLLALTPVLKTPALWAALLLLPILGVGPALSPDFVSYPIPEQPAAIFGDQQIMLIDAGLEGELAPGQTVTVRAVWQALQPIDFDYNIFIHIVDDAGNAVAQFDGQPRKGSRPMTSWLPGEIIPDAYQLSIPDDAPPSLHVRMGLYNWQTLDRLPLAAGGDALTISD